MDNPPMHKLKKLNYYRDDHCPWLATNLQVKVALPIIIWMQQRRKRVHRRRKHLAILASTPLYNDLINIVLDYALGYPEESSNDDKKLIESSKRSPKNYLMWRFDPPPLIDVSDFLSADEVISGLDQDSDTE